MINENINAGFNICLITQFSVRYAICLSIEILILTATSSLIPPKYLRADPC